MYCAHQSSSEIFKDFKSDALEFQHLLLQQLLKQHINLKGVFLILSQTTSTHAKRKDNMNLVLQLGIKSIPILFKQINLMHGQNIGTNSE